MAKKAARNLVIVESPAKAKTIGKYLGPDYEVRASMGHLRDLPKSKLGVDVEHDFEPNYRPIRGKEELINELKKLSKASDTVYLATDPDREGEAISWHLKNLLDLSDEKAKRVTFNEITRKVVTESIHHPREIDQDLVDAQQARRILDRIVGYELSPLLWKKIRRGLSAGRVQSVAMRLVADREKEIKALREFPSTGLIFIDTLQMVRDNTSAKVNAYAQDYKDLSSLKKLADDHGICIFVVHHTRKERDSSNIFNDMTGSTGILGVADMGMILRKDDRFGDCATLCITGRDVEEKKLKMQMRGVRWEITEALSAKDLRKERIPDFVFQVADFLLAHGRFRGTVSQLLAAVGNTELKPNLASKHLTRHYSDVLLPLGITYEYRKTAAARLVLLELHDGADGHDGSSGSERLASLRKQNDGTFRLPQASSQASSASWEEAEDDEELPL